MRAGAEALPVSSKTGGTGWVIQAWSRVALLGSFQSADLVPRESPELQIVPPASVFILQGSFLLSSVSNEIEKMNENQTRRRTQSSGQEEKRGSGHAFSQGEKKKEVEAREEGALLGLLRNAQDLQPQQSF